MGPSFGVFETDNNASHIIRKLLTRHDGRRREHHHDHHHHHQQQQHHHRCRQVRESGHAFGVDQSLPEESFAEDVEESDGTEVSRQILRRALPAVFYPGEDGDVPAVQTARTTGKKREREKIPLAAETSSVVFCARFSPRAVFCADGDILLSFSIWYVRNSWTKNARRTI